MFVVEYEGSAACLFVMGGIIPAIRLHSSLLHGTAGCNLPKPAVSHRLSLPTLYLGASLFNNLGIQTSRHLGPYDTFRGFLFFFFKLT